MDVRLLRTLGIILLVVLIVVLGLPLAIGMGGMGSTGRCPECQTGGGFPVFGVCLAILGVMILLSLGAFGEVLATRSRRFARVPSAALERPPRLLSV